MDKRVLEENLHVKRAYEKPSAEDGVRVLVDRLWPRGVRKADAAIDHWFKELSLSTELRKWFAHDPTRWPALQARAEPARRSTRSTARARVQGPSHAVLCRSRRTP